MIYFYENYNIKYIKFSNFKLIKMIPHNLGTGMCTCAHRYIYNTTSQLLSRIND